MTKTIAHHTASAAISTGRAATSAVRGVHSQLPLPQPPSYGGYWSFVSASMILLFILYLAANNRLGVWLAFFSWTAPQSVGTATNTGSGSSIPSAGTITPSSIPGVPGISSNPLAGIPYLGGLVQWLTGAGATTATPAPTTGLLPAIGGAATGGAVGTPATTSPSTGPSSGGMPPTPF